MLIKEFLLWAVSASIVGFITLLTIDGVGIEDKLIKVFILTVVYII